MTHLKSRASEINLAGYCALMVSYNILNILSNMTNFKNAEFTMRTVFNFKCVEERNTVGLKVHLDPVFLIFTIAFIMFMWHNFLKNAL